MAEKLDPKEIVTSQEIIIANSMEIEALTQLLVGKGILTFVCFVGYLLSR
jgi:hypothetical protein